MRSIEEAGKELNLEAEPVMHPRVVKLLYNSQRQPLIQEVVQEGTRVTDGRSYECGDRAKPNKTAKRPFTQASLRGKRWVNPASLHRMPTPVQRCWRSPVQALSTRPEPSGHPTALYAAEWIGS
jgi:hypothetical protein